MKKQVFGYIITGSKAVEVPANTETKTGCWTYYQAETRLEVTKQLEAWAPNEPIPAILIIVDKSTPVTDVFVRTGANSALLWVPAETPIHEQALIVANLHAKDWRNDANPSDAPLLNESQAHHAEENPTTQANPEA